MVESLEAIEDSKVTRSILVLAPHPFFQNRGTPIAVRLLVEELALLGYKVHLLVFHEGEDLNLNGVHIHRIPALWGVKNIPPSISLKKIVCDIVMFFKSIGLLRKYQFDLVHAGEESAFMALVLKKVFRVPYIYDMDSSLPIQIVDKLTFLKFTKPVLDYFEGLAVRGSCGVVAVCKALEDIVLSYAPDKEVVRLEDISLLDGTVNCDEQLRQRYGIVGPIMLYVGNLEGYQGIDLMLEGFQLALSQGCQGNVVIIGGTEQTIAIYESRAAELGISDNTYFCGPRAVELLGHYLGQADVLVSPRVQGNNTPMKLYSYLDSGKPVLATDLPTHTQVLTDQVSCLVAADREAMAKGMTDLLENSDLRRELGCKGKQLAREKYSLEAFRGKLATFYERIWQLTKQ